MRITLMYTSDRRLLRATQREDCNCGAGNGRRLRAGRGAGVPRQGCRCCVFSPAAPEGPRARFQAATLEKASRAHGRVGAERQTSHLARNKNRLHFGRLGVKSNLGPRLPADLIVREIGTRGCVEFSLSADLLRTLRLMTPSDAEKTTGSGMPPPPPSGKYSRSGDTPKFE